MTKIHSENRISDRFKRTFIGDRAFYTTVFSLVIPIVVQNTITNFVNLLDNIMIGQVGTAQMSGVAITNQLLFVFSLAIFGGLAGPGIFGAQFYGAGNHEGMRNTFRYKLWIAAFVLVAGVSIFLTKSDTLISLYLTGDGDAAQAASMLFYGRQYLKIMLWGLLPFSVSQIYSSSLRETGETMVPMKASVVAVLTNLCLNYILIYGKLGFPALGVAGAAIATVISRYAEVAVIVIYTHRNALRFPFIEKVFSSIRVPKVLTFKILKKGAPLLVNELLWSLSVTTLMQIFSTTGLNVVAGLNISSTISNLFNVVFVSLGSAVAVMTGQSLGAGDIKSAKGNVWKLIFFSAASCVLVGGVLAAVSPFIPLLYNTTDDVRRLATHFMLVSAACMPFHAITHSSYFTLRSGGKVIATFIFDSVYSWCIFVPFVYVLTHYTGLSIFAIYPIAYLADVVKAVIGILVVRTGFWAQNFVAEKTGDELAT